MRYRIKVYLGSDIGWLFIVGDDQEPCLYTLEQAIEAAEQYINRSTAFVEIVDEEGKVYENYPRD